MKEHIELLLEEMVRLQEKKLLLVASDFVPTITTEDLLQPVDYIELEENPYFRYEEGVLAGLHTVRSALLALFQEM